MIDCIFYFFVIIGFSNENCCTLHKSEDKFLTTLRIVHKTRLTLANVTKIDDYDQFGFFWWNFWIILPSFFFQFNFIFSCMYVIFFFLYTTFTYSLESFRLWSFKLQNAKKYFYTYQFQTETVVRFGFWKKSIAGI